MKHKISAALLSFVLLLSSFTFVFSASAAAVTPAEAVAYYEICQEWYGFLKEAWQLILDNFGYDEAVFKGMSKLEVRSRLLNEFKPLAPSITAKISKTSLTHLISNWSIQDYEAIENEFGQDVASYCNTNSSDFFDYYHAVMHYFDNLADFVNALYNANLSDYNLDDKGNVQVPIEDFKQELEKQNNTIDPKNRSMIKYSWRDLSNNQDNVNLNCFARGIFTDGKSVVGTTLEEGIYIQVYMRRNGYMYYAPYQYKLYLEKESLGGHSPVYQYTWYLEPIYYERLDGVSLDTFKAVGAQFSDYVDSNGKVTSCDMSKYVSLGLNSYNDYWGFELKGYTSLAGCQKNLDSDAVKHYIKTNGSWSSSTALNAGGTDFSSLHASERKFLLRSNDVTDKYGFGKYTVNNADGTASVRWGITHFFDRKGYSTCEFTNQPINTHDTGYVNGSLHSDINICAEGHNCDFGFLISSEQFTTTYQFDTTRLPSNSTVTILGDSVYDYSITDNSTGETSTIYNYVTNNYSYPETSGGNTSGGNGGGTVGGNITVGGQVDVGGKVDINVNVNGNGDNYSMPDTSGMNDYLESALDDSSGFRKFLKVFFDFLPPPILVLLGTALTCAIIARLCGR